MLGGVGVGESEERLYRTLIRLGAATVAELAAATDADEGPLRSTLATLEEKGLASRAPDPFSGSCPPRRTWPSRRSPPAARRRSRAPGSPPSS